MTKNGIHAWNVNKECMHKSLAKRTYAVYKNLAIAVAPRLTCCFIVLYSWEEESGNVESWKIKLRYDMIVFIKNLSRDHIEKGQDLFSVFTKTRIWF